MYRIVLISFLYFSLQFGVSSAIPTYIELCTKFNNSECLLKNVKAVVKHLAINGDPELNLPNIGKFIAPLIDMHATKDLKVRLSDLEFTGVENIQINEASIEENILHLNVFIPRLQYIGDYTFEGRLLILTLAASGRMNVTQVELTIDYKAKLKTQARDGEKYYYVDTKKSDLIVNIEDIKGNSFSFQNLFHDKRISDEMNRFLNENWREVYDEVRETMGPAYAINIFTPFINGILKHIPIRDFYKN